MKIKGLNHINILVLFILVFSANYFIFYGEKIPNSTGLDLTPISSQSHSPIYIDGNDALNSFCAGNDTDGSDTNPHIIRDYIINNNVNMNGIEIRNVDLHLLILNVTLSDNFNEVGLKIHSSSNIRIRYSVFSDNDIDIILVNSSNITIESNQFINSNCSIYLYKTEFTKLISNSIEESYTGLIFEDSDSNDINNNLIINTDYCSAYLNISNFNNFYKNTFSNSSFGLFIENSDENSFLSNNMCYNEEDGIILKWSDSNIIKSNNISNNGEYGIYSYYSHKNDIIFNIIWYNIEGTYDELGLKNNYKDNHIRYTDEQTRVKTAWITVIVSIIVVFAIFIFWVIKHEINDETNSILSKSNKRFVEKYDVSHLSGANKGSRMLGKSKINIHSKSIESKLFKQNIPSILESKYPFIQDDIFLIARIHSDSGKQELVLQKINLENNKVIHEEKMQCIHTAVLDIPISEFSNTIEDEKFDEMVLKIRSSGNLKQINLSIDEKFKAFKSWVAGIAEYGIESIKLQRSIENAANLQYPISQFLARALIKINDEFLIQYMDYIEKTCRYEGIYHLSSILSNIDMIFQIFENYSENSDGFIKLLINSYPDILKLIYFKLCFEFQYMIAQKISTSQVDIYKILFKSPNWRIRKLIAINPDAVDYNEYENLFYDEEWLVKKSILNNQKAIKKYPELAKEIEISAKHEMNLTFISNDSFLKVDYGDMLKFSLQKINPKSKIIEISEIISYVDTKNKYYNKNNQDIEEIISILRNWIESIALCKSEISDYYSEIFKFFNVTKSISQNIKTYIKKINPNHFDEKIEEILKELISFVQNNKESELNKALNRLNNVLHSFKYEFDYENDIWKEFFEFELPLHIFISTIDNKELLYSKYCQSYIIRELEKDNDENYDIFLGFDENFKVSLLFHPNITESICLRYYSNTKLKYFERNYWFSKYSKPTIFEHYIKLISKDNLDINEHNNFSCPITTSDIMNDIDDLNNKMDNEIIKEIKDYYIRINTDPDDDLKDENRNDFFIKYKKEEINFNNGIIFITDPEIRTYRPYFLVILPGIWNRYSIPSIEQNVYINIESELLIHQDWVKSPLYQNNWVEFELDDFYDAYYFDEVGIYKLDEGDNSLKGKSGLEIMKGSGDGSEYPKCYYYLNDFGDIIAIRIDLNTDHDLPYVDENKWRFHFGNLEYNYSFKEFIDFTRKYSNIISEMLIPYKRFLEITYENEKYNRSQLLGKIRRIVYTIDPYFIIKYMNRLKKTEMDSIEIKKNVQILIDLCTEENFEDERIYYDVNLFNVDERDETDFDENGVDMVLEIIQNLILDFELPLSLFTYERYYQFLVNCNKNKVKKYLVKMVKKIQISQNKLDIGNRENLDSFLIPIKRWLYDPDGYEDGGLEYRGKFLDIYDNEEEFPDEYFLSLFIDTYSSSKVLSKNNEINGNILGKTDLSSEHTIQKDRKENKKNINYLNRVKSNIAFNNHNNLEKNNLNKERLDETLIKTKKSFSNPIIRAVDKVFFYIMIVLFFILIIGLFIGVLYYLYLLFVVEDMLTISITCMIFLILIFIVYFKNKD